MNRRWVVCATLAAALLAGCARPPAAPAELTIAVVPKAVAHQFWTTVKAGAEAAGRELGAQILWKGPSSELDLAAQKSIVEDFTTQQVSAIVLAACDASGMVETVKQAEAAGVPVITIDSGLNWDGVRSLVATDNVAAARLAGEELIKLIGGQGKVGLIPFVKGAASSEDREQGFREAIQAKPGVTLAATDYSESDEAKGKAVAQDMLTSTPDLAGIFAANEPGVVGAANALTEMGKAGQVKLVGYDASPTELSLLERGVVQALAVQDPFKMGYEGVKHAVNAARGQPVQPRVDTGVTIVTQANLATPAVQQLLHPTGPQTP